MCVWARAGGKGVYGYMLYVLYNSYSDLLMWERSTFRAVMMLATEPMAAAAETQKQRTQRVLTSHHLVANLGTLCITKCSCKREGLMSQSMCILFSCCTAQMHTSLDSGSAVSGRWRF